MTAVTTTPLTWKQRFFLAVLVPGFIMLVLELSARALLAFGFAQTKKAEPIGLEMPTWMLHDANAMARATPSKDAFDWLHLFVEGDGFRVHLLPHTSRDVKNTFSLIPADRERRYRITSNSLGFRSPEVAERKTPGTFRVLVFGDSSSFGWGVNAEDSWSVLLQQGLQERYPQRKVEVVNFAIPGDSSAYGRLLFDTFAPRFSPDLVILGFGANDAKRVFTSHTDQIVRFRDNRGLLAVAKLLKVSALYRLLEQTLRSPGTGDPPRSKLRVPAVTPQDYTKNLQYMASSAKKMGSENALLLALCTPNNYARAARSEAKRSGYLWFNGQNQLVKLLPRIQAGEVYPEYVQRMKAAYGSALAQNRLFYVTSDGCHPNELGHRFVAEHLTEMITKANVIR